MSDERVDHRSATESLHRQADLASSLAEALQEADVEDLWLHSGFSRGQSDTAGGVPLGELIGNRSLHHAAGAVHQVLRKQLGDGADLLSFAKQAEAVLGRDPEMKAAVDFLSRRHRTSFGVNPRAYRIGLIVALLLGGWLPSLTDGEFKMDDVSIPFVFVASELLKQLEKTQEEETARGKVVKNPLQKGTARRRRKKRGKRR